MFDQFGTDDDIDPKKLLLETWKYFIHRNIPNSVGNVPTRSLSPVVFQKEKREYKKKY